MKVKTFDPQHTYLSLSPQGDAIKTVGGEAFWKLAQNQREAYGQDWLMSEYNCNGDWDAARLGSYHWLSLVFCAAVLYLLS